MMLKFNGQSNMAAIKNRPFEWHAVKVEQCSMYIKYVVFFIEVFMEYIQYRLLCQLLFSHFGILF